MYYIDNARSDTQLQKMQSLQSAGICLFCPEHLPEHQEILFSTTHWTATPNRFPYAGTTQHFLLVSREHTNDLLNLERHVREDFWTALTVLTETRNMPDYVVKIRSGDPGVTGGTIFHLHAHVTDTG